MGREKGKNAEHQNAIKFKLLKKNGYKVLYVSLMRTKKQKSMYGKYTKDKKKEMRV